MTKLLVLSDSHKTPGAIKSAMRAEADAAAVIYLGDGLSDLELVLTEFPGKRVYAVAGNCDHGALEPQDGLAVFEKLIIYYTHGHNHGVKYETDSLVRAAKARGAEIALFGHSHRPCRQLQDGVLLFNPGSCGNCYTGPNTYGVLTLENGKVVSAEHKEVPRG